MSFRAGNFSTANIGLGVVRVWPEVFPDLRTFCEREDPMRIPAPERCQHSAGRGANRRALRLDAFGAFFILLAIGCRSAGTTASPFVRGNVSVGETDSGPARATHRNPRFGTPHLPFAAKSKQPSRMRDSADPPPVDEDAIDTPDTSDDTEVTANDRVSKKGLTRRDSSTAQTAGFEEEDRDNAESEIEVARFRDDSTPAGGIAEQHSASPRQLDESNTRLFKNISNLIPPEIPGATAPRHRLPPRTDDEDLAGKARKIKVIDELFPQRAEPAKIEEPSDRVMTLEQLEDLALENNPILAQALAAITVNEGAAIESSLYPNPIMGYESDTVGSSFTRNYQGVFVQQPIKTAGKLPLARSIANIDVMNAQLAYERTKNDILRSVRAGYFNVLVAQRTIRFNEAFERMTRRVSNAVRERLKGGEHPAYELDQYNSLVSQARATLVQSQNRFIAAWKQLAVATGIPQLKPAVLEGRAEMSVPNLDYSTLLDRILAIHPDLYAARNLEQQAKTLVRYQRALVVPDVTVGGAFQNDFTVPGFSRTSYNLNVNVPLPIFDRNQGNIKSALAKLKMMSLQGSVKTMELTDQLADAFERYQTGRYEAEAYLTQILPDQVRAYEGNYAAYISDNPDVAFGDIILAQQNLSTGVATYVASLLQQWIALTDIANLIQLRDFQDLLRVDSPFAKDANGIVPSPQPQEGAGP
jgi:outer membrane protein, heavy metal efflux system